MNSPILVILFAYLIFLFVASVGLSVYLLYDLWSGNFRKFLLSGDERKGATETGPSIRE